LGKTKKELATVTCREALAHPTWNMGAKISVDSATLMNKGLEVIEAKYLFNVSVDQILVRVHRQSIVHSMVAFEDGSVLAQLGHPDMKLPIQAALAYPRRLSNSYPRLDLAELSDLSFEKPDLESFPCLRLAFEAGRRGGTAEAVLNAANEKAVELFLQDKISFLDIPRLIEKTLGEHDFLETPDLQTLIQQDLWARNFVVECCRKT
jgi:1-deoxy-D-xylulose-5-phosphate reductoisomerase